jgi:hypothetical protein
MTKLQGRYFFSADRRVTNGRFCLMELNDVISANRDHESCPWCENDRYSHKSFNCADCDTFPVTREMRY